MPVLRAFPFSVKLQCDNLVSHSGVGEYKKRTCVIPFMKCIKASTIKSDRTVLHQQRIKEIKRKGQRRRCLLLHPPTRQSTNGILPSNYFKASRYLSACSSFSFVNREDIIVRSEEICYVFCCHS